MTRMTVTCRWDAGDLIAAPREPKPVMLIPARTRIENTDCWVWDLDTRQVSAGVYRTRMRSTYAMDPTDAEQYAAKLEQIAGATVTINELDSYPIPLTVKSCPSFDRLADSLLHPAQRAIAFYMEDAAVKVRQGLLRPLPDDFQERVQSARRRDSLPNGELLVTDLSLQGVLCFAPPKSESPQYFRGSDGETYRVRSDKQTWQVELL